MWIVSSHNPPLPLPPQLHTPCNQGPGCKLQTGDFKTRACVCKNCDSGPWHGILKPCDYLSILILKSLLEETIPEALGC